jgi:hypothetical protein
MTRRQSFAHILPVCRDSGSFPFQRNEYVNVTLQIITRSLNGGGRINSGLFPRTTSLMICASKEKTVELGFGLRIE